MFSPLIDQLITSLRVLPGVGPKSATRMAFHLLERNREGAQALSQALAEASAQVKRCEQCRTLTEQPCCAICASSKRDRQLMCVVESPADVVAIEQSGTFSGVYFVLHGKLSPIDGVGPREIGIDQLEERFQAEPISEVIIATNPTVEGEATAHYIAERAKKNAIKVTRIAHGVPLGGELEYIDGGTLAHAISSRREI
ncbi:recombination mediator RecR [Teredinibacter turnerae]|uniref:Recombination protein RecR n=1 Tax=Teredinibacter turnerae (strain ATCC 39867 / T7901) TaxID=377629 RepID=C5BMI9_TERTT|nr:recombination mediator RecR [Teredinibacter turnerae]ACR14350.1 recombination protein RecR [Teredinibacter turnerae T7901]